MRSASSQVRFLEMRRARFYILILGLTLLPQVVAASDLVRWLAAQGQLALGLSVPGLLLALNLPMLAEVLRRKKSARLPRFLAAMVQTPWTAFWLGSLFYAILRAGWTVAHLGAAPMPVWLAPSLSLRAHSRRAPPSPRPYRGGGPVPPARALPGWRRGPPRGPLD